MKDRLLVWHTTRNLLRCPLDEGQCHLCAHPLPYSQSVPSSRAGLAHSSGTPTFMAAAEGTPLNSMALVASRADAFGFHGTVTNGGILLNQPPLPRAQQKDSRLKHTPGVSAKEAY